MIEDFLVYLPDPYGVGRSTFAVATRNHINLIPASKLSESCNRVITYDASTLIDDLRRVEAKLPHTIIDVADALRLAVGVSKADGGEQVWSFWKRIRRYFNSTSEWKLAKALHEGRIQHPEVDLINVVGRNAEALIGLWDEAKQLLAKNQELKRFVSIEVPSAQIFYHRQMHGVLFDVAATEQALAEASSAKYASYRRVAEVLKVSPTGLNYWNVSPYLGRTDLSEINGDLTGYNLRDQMKMAIDVSEFARDFTRFQDSERDVGTLTRLSDSGGRVYPIFHPCGTISARILVSDPYLQELRKSYRNVFVAEHGKSLCYFDYSQFEPGIMASLSNDPKLTRLYNEGDVYKALSVELFGNNERRDVAKKVFLAFSYGMSSANIAKLISGKAAKQSQLEEFEAIVNGFFDRFGNLTEFRRNAVLQLRRTGSVSSLFGNHRQRASKGALSFKEERWALSHIIQSTASFIFKKTLISVDEKFGHDAIILPVHDAMLMQLPAEHRDEAVEYVKETMIKTFSDVCPNVRARVVCGAFH